MTSVLTTASYCRTLNSACLTDTKIQVGVRSYNLVYVCQTAFEWAVFAGGSLLYL